MACHEVRKCGAGDELFFYDLASESVDRRHGTFSFLGMGSFDRLVNAAIHWANQERLLLEVQQVSLGALDRLKQAQVNFVVSFFSFKGVEVKRAQLEGMLQAKTQHQDSDFFMALFRTRGVVLQLVRYEASQKPVAATFCHREFTCISATAAAAVPNNAAQITPIDQAWSTLTCLS